MNEDFFGAEPSGVYWLLVIVMILNMNVNDLEQRWFWFLLVWSHNQVDGFRGECFVGGVEGGGGGGGEGGGGRWREHWVAGKKWFRRQNIGLTEIAME